MKLGENEVIKIFHKGIHRALHGTFLGTRYCGAFDKVSAFPHYIHVFSNGREDKGAFDDHLVCALSRSFCK